MKIQSDGKLQVRKLLLGLWKGFMSKDVALIRLIAMRVKVSQIKGKVIKAQEQRENRFLPALLSERIFLSLPLTQTVGALKMKKDLLSCQSEVWKCESAYSER